MLFPRPIKIFFFTLCSLLSIIDFGKTENESSPIAKPIIGIEYDVESRPLRMEMDHKKTLNVTIFINKLDLIKVPDLHKVIIVFKVNTLSPQFNILGLYGDKDRAIVMNRPQIDAFQFNHKAQFKLIAEYIGHVTIEPTAIEYYSSTGLKTKETPVTANDDQRLHIVIVPSDGIWNTVFIVSVSIFITITYINVGAQLDAENTQQLIKRPKTMVLGLLITILTMPIVSWFVGQFFLSKQNLYRVGAFIFAAGPAASASTLWTVMLDADKELSVGLQVASTICATFTMPILLYIMDSAMLLEGSHHTVKVPYARLTQTLCVLSIALWIGYRFVGQNKRAKQLSAKVFRPLTFFVLFFIIIFSSIIYYYIYAMFDWTIVLTALVITVLTYTISGLLSFAISGNKDHAIAISISGTYKNSGIAFAVLVVAFDSPDTYIAYVPCLTQVVTTSLTLYLIYCILKLVNCIKRRNQPSPITAEVPPTVSSFPEGGTSHNKPKEARSDSVGEKSIKSEGSNSNELTTINIHDEVPGEPTSRKGSVEVERRESETVETEDVKNNSLKPEA